MAYSILALAAAAAAQAAAQQTPLNLSCGGAGTANKVSRSTVHTNTQISGMVGGNIVSGTGSGTSTINIPRQQGFEDQVDVRLFSGEDKIRFPRTMLPGFHGGSDGWFRLKDVVADAHSIHASAYINFINHPKVYIDRRTGTISISGKAGDYSGQCQAVTADAPARF